MPLAPIMTLCKPICLINCSAFSLAPAPMDSIEITAPTPEMIPSMVNRERSLRLVRLSSDWVTLSRKFSSSIPGPSKPGAPCRRLAVSKRPALSANSEGPAPLPSRRRQRDSRPVAGTDADLSFLRRLESVNHAKNLRFSSVNALSGITSACCRRLRRPKCLRRLPGRRGCTHLSSPGRSLDSACHLSSGGHVRSEYSSASWPASCFRWCSRCAT